LPICANIKRAGGLETARAIFLQPRLIAAELHPSILVSTFVAAGPVPYQKPRNVLILQKPDYRPIRVSIDRFVPAFQGVLSILYKIIC